MSEREDSASEKFNCSVTERASFEAGIKTATIYHQFVGSPVSLKTVVTLEKAIENAILTQPYVKSVDVKIDRSVLPEMVDEFSYVSLTGDMIDAVVVILIDGVEVKAEMRYDDELQYPLMYISEVKI